MDHAYQRPGLDTEAEGYGAMKGTVYLLGAMLCSALSEQKRFKDMAKAMRGDTSGLTNVELEVIDYIHEEWPHQEGGLHQSAVDIVVAIKGPFAEQNITQNVQADKLKSAIEEALQLLNTPNMKFIAMDTLKKVIRA